MIQFETAIHNNFRGIRPKNVPHSECTEFFISAVCDFIFRGGGSRATVHLSWSPIEHRRLAERETHLPESRCLNHASSYIRSESTFHPNGILTPRGIVYGKKASKQSANMTYIPTSLTQIQDFILPTKNLILLSRLYSRIFERSANLEIQIRQW